MDVLTSGIAVAGDVFNGFWSFATANVVIFVPLMLGLVGLGITLFMSLKKRLGGKRGKKGKK